MDLPHKHRLVAVAHDALGLGSVRTSVGRCEVVCFSPEHTGSFGTQSVTRARTVIEAWADRTAALSALPGVEQVFPFENRGEAIGVTLPHPHGQIYAYPYVTPRTRRLLENISRTSPDLMQRVLDFEREGGRVILAGEHWTAYVPFAARWPIEVHLMPHRHVPDFAESTDAERDELAGIYLRLLRGIDAKTMREIFDSHGERWYRLYRSSDDSSEEREIGYRYVRAWAGQRSDVGGKGSISAAEGNVPGYVVQIKARSLDENTSGPDQLVYDSEGTYFVSEDFKKEAWKLRLVIRRGNESTNFTEIGARDGFEELLVTTSSPNGRDESYRQKIKEEGYLPLPLALAVELELCRHRP